MKAKRSKVLALRVLNIKSIREISIDLNGKIHEVRGDAGQGKTSILTSIEAALRGIDPDLIRNGETSAEIELQLSDATIKRIINRNGKKPSLKVKDGNGKDVEKAKDFLRAICGTASFRPLAWVQLGGGEGKGLKARRREQRDQLLQALGLSLTVEDVSKAVNELGEPYVKALAEADTPEVDYDQSAFAVCRRLEEGCYEYRKGVNSELKHAENVLELAPKPERAAPEGSLLTVVGILESAREAFYAAQGKAESMTELRGRRHELVERIKSSAIGLPSRDEVQKIKTREEGACEFHQKKIDELQKDLEAAVSCRDQAAQKLTAISDLTLRIDRQEARMGDLASLELELVGSGPVDLEPLQAAMDGAEANYDARVAQDAQNEAFTAHAEAAERSKLFDELIALFRDEIPKALLEKSDIGIPDLTVDEDQILVGEVPLYRLGTSQQIRIGVRVAAAQNPLSGFILIDGAESLGSKDRAALASEADELELQLIMTFVDEHAKPSEHVTVMKDGEAVKA